jgi:hypothetical protein
MKLIEEFNLRLNSENQNRYYDWRNYRHEVTSVVEEVVSSMQHKKRVVIVGTGGLNDLDVDLLLSTFEEVVFSDIDLSNVKEGLIRQNITRKNYKLIRTDYTGFEKEAFFETFISLIRSGAAEDRVTQYIEKVFEQVDNYKFLKEYEKSVDLVIVLPIYTQLVFYQFNTIIHSLINEGYNEMFLRSLPERFLSLLPRLFNSFNLSIDQLLNEHGELIVCSDFFEDHPESTFIKNIQRSIQNQTEVDKFYENYHSEYGFGLGDYGYQYFLDKFVTVFTKWLIWPFNNNRSMVVKVGHFKK